MTILAPGEARDSEVSFHGTVVSSGTVDGVVSWLMSSEGEYSQRRGRRTMPDSSPRSLEGTHATPKTQTNQRRAENRRRECERTDEYFRASGSIAANAPTRRKLIERPNRQPSRTANAIKARRSPCLQLNGDDYGGACSRLNDNQPARICAKYPGIQGHYLRLWRNGPGFQRDDRQGWLPMAGHHGSEYLFQIPSGACLVYRGVVDSQPTAKVIEISALGTSIGRFCAAHLRRSLSRLSAELPLARAPCGCGLTAPIGMARIGYWRSSNGIEQGSAVARGRGDKRERFSLSIAKATQACYHQRTDRAGRRVPTGYVPKYVYARTGMPRLRSSISKGPWVCVSRMHARVRVRDWPVYSVPREKILRDVAITDEPTHTVRQRQTGQHRDRTGPSRSVSGL
ncbi:hypothetical protein KM043_008193 [Ampulex compressa]|nr:hypothetical protein KM043_008193 [Ampulex compressa]